MYTDNAYWHNQVLDFKDKKHPLFVGSAGTYHLFTRPKLPTHRPRGRLDFQLLYIASGKAHFFFHGAEEIVPAGNMVLYRPKEEQRYYYYGVDQTEVYWVHFTGNNVTNILRKYGFPDKAHVIHTGTSLEYKRIFLHFIQELKLCKPSYETVLAHELEYLFILLFRLQGKKPREKSAFLMDEMNRAVTHFHSNYNQQISIEAYARERGMSVSWFIRNLKIIPVPPPHSISSLCASPMPRASWNLPPALSRRLPRLSAMKIPCTSAACLKRTVACRRPSSGSS